MTISDTLLILATLLSPLIAVQVSKYLDKRKESSERKHTVFRQLMATRASTLSPVHVEALNRIDLEFSSRNESDKAVFNAWLQYRDHLGVQFNDFDAWNTKRFELLIEMLEIMGRNLGYDMNKTHIKNTGYLPKAHECMQSEQDMLRKLLIALLDGKRCIPIIIANQPHEDD